MDERIVIEGAVDQITDFVMEIGDLTEGFVLFQFKSQIKIQRCFWFKVGIAMQPRFISSAAWHTWPIQVKFARCRCAVRRTDVRLEAQIFIDLICGTEFSRHFAAEGTAVIPAYGRNEQPVRACEPLVLYIKRGVSHGVFAKRAYDTLT